MKRRVHHLLLPVAFTTSFLWLSGCAADHAAPVHRLGTQIDSAAGAGTVMVRQNDTVWRISQRYRLPLRGIIDLNNLTPPYHLQEGQRLRLPPPMEHRVGDQETLTSIARLYGVPASQLSRNNNIAAPYQLRAGQVIRIPTTPKQRQEQKQKQQAIAAAVPLPATSPPMPAPSPVTVTPSAPAQTATTYAAPVTSSARPSSTSTVIASNQTPSRAGFIWPIRGKVISSYGPKAGHLHNDGINIAAPRGAAVAAAMDGTVAYVGNDLASYGNLVLIRHDNGLVTAYAHLDQVSVVRGERIRRGQRIGAVGSTGTVSNPQLHFEVRRGIESLNPTKYLGS